MDNSLAEHSSIYTIDGSMDGNGRDSVYSINIYHISIKIIYINMYIHTYIYNIYIYIDAVVLSSLPV